MRAPVHFAPFSLLAVLVVPLLGLGAVPTPLHAQDPPVIVAPIRRGGPTAEDLERFRRAEEAARAREAARQAESARAAHIAAQMKRAYEARINQARRTAEVVAERERIACRRLLGGSRGSCARPAY